MTLKAAISTLLVFLIFKSGYAQLCSSPGQSPSKALPICGLTMLNQAVVEPCSTNGIQIGICGTYPLPNVFW
ncbi:MAG TPA: hypothetical protein VFV08_09190 [Puia sp.]|nr:hypothetical protein [Puia sp.]